MEAPPPLFMQPAPILNPLAGGGLRLLADEYTEEFQLTIDTIRPKKRGFAIFQDPDVPEVSPGTLRYFHLFSQVSIAFADIRREICLLESWNYRRQCRWVLLIQWKIWPPLSPTKLVLSREQMDTNHLTLCSQVEQS